MQKNLLKKYQFYPANTTAIVLVDVQSDFLNKGGQGTELTNQVSQSIGFRENLLDLLGYARDKGYRLVYVPYTNKITSRYPTPIHEKLASVVSDDETSLFSSLSEGFQPRPKDMVIHDRTKISIFQETVLAEKLESEGIEHLVFAGPLINVGIDSSARDAVQLGFHTTLIKDCVSASTMGEYLSAVDVTFPRFAQTVITLDEFKNSPS
jgi:nicotinamidase-related amidase